MKAKKLLLCLLLLSLVTYLAPAWGNTHSLPYRAVIHAHSGFSSGAYTFPELEKIAKDYGIDAIFLTDNHALSFFYGFWPFPYVLWAAITNPSVMNDGPRNYLATVKEANSTNASALFIPGLEVIPRWYWTGSYFSGLTNCNMQRNLMILGVDNPSFIRRIPAVTGFLWGRDNWWIIFSRALIVAWVIALIFFFIRCKQGFGSAFSFAKQVILPLLIVTFLFNYLAGSVQRFNVFGPKGNVAAEQAVIDLAHKNDYFVYWAHPEAFDDTSYNGVKLRTQPYPEMLLRCRNYDAFGVLYEQENKLYLPNSVWDTVLNEYLQGTRIAPIWGVGEMLYHKEGAAGKKLNNVENLIWAEKKTPSALLHALKRGAFYCRRRNGNDFLTLSDFQVNGATSGETSANTNGEIHVLAEVNSSRPDYNFIVTILRNGEKLKEMAFVGSGKIDLVDFWTRGKPAYYRLYARGAYPVQLVSNPIFLW